MKKFILKISLWATLFLGIGIMLIQIPQFNFYGNYLLQYKLNYFNHKPYNTIICGSSRVYRQVDPNIIDSLNSGLKSFNLGIPSMLISEDFYQLRNDNLKNVKYIIIELRPYVDIPAKNENSDRSFYFHDFKTVTEETQQFKELGELNASLESLYFGVRNIFYFKKLKELKKLKYRDNFSEANYNGFEPISNDNRNFQGRRRYYLKDTLKIQKRLEEKVTMRKYSVLEENLINLNNELKKKGGKLILYLPPINKNTVDTKNLIKHDIPIIDLWDPKQYPELYYSKNIFDIGHLNDKGSKIMTTILAEKLNQIIQ